MKSLLTVVVTWSSFLALFIGGIFLCFNGPAWLGITCLVAAVIWMFVSLNADKNGLGI